MQILHVEDDRELAEAVEAAFDAFGFRGKTLHAETVAEADQILDAVALRSHGIELVISDMSLPDGTGLDVVRHVRRHPAWMTTPILILSGDATPDSVGRAYALGANSYVSKGSRGRSMHEVVEGVYEHWLRDVVFPVQSKDPHRYLARAMQNCGRGVDFYLRMARQFPLEGDFWVTRALGASNQANLLGFLQRQVSAAELPSELLHELEQGALHTEAKLVQIEHALEQRPIATPDEAYERMVEIASLWKTERFARSISHLFPVATAAMSALCEAIAKNLDEVADWIDSHTGTLALRGKAAKLRAESAHLRELAQQTA